MDRVAKNIIDSYSQGPDAIYADWKEREALPPYEAVDIWRDVSRLFFRDKNADLIFLSPTSNLPTHEVAIFKDEVQSRKGSTIFLVGDLANLNPKDELAQVANLQDDKQKFIYFKWDARNLPVKKGTVDSIWDRRGWIWHSANLEDNREKATLDSLINYRKMLKKGGIIILDADYGMKSGQRGHSTDSVVRTRIREDFFEKPEIKKMFDSYYIGEDQKRVLVLIKK
ncbi:MAG: hypothetical protein HYV90_01320 [Candidatus Woesebacteria bacterium]|nr:MAG: hypothetical protein HYV90_01320 [Candidatus Woesebacteria bacterium]